MLTPCCSRSRSALKDMTVNGLMIELDCGYRKYVLVAADESTVLAWKAALQTARGSGAQARPPTPQRAFCQRTPPTPRARDASVPSCPPSAPTSHQTSAHPHRSRFPFSEQEALPSWAAADPFDEDDEDSPVRPARGKGKAKGKGAAAGSLLPPPPGGDSNPFGNMVGTNSEYAQNYGDVDPDDESATLEQLEGAIAHHEQARASRPRQGTAGHGTGLEGGRQVLCVWGGRDGCGGRWQECVCRGADGARVPSLPPSLPHPLSPAPQGIESSLQRTLRLAQSTANVGANTLQQMHEQGEQLDRIARDEQKVKANLDTSDRILRTMGSWRGAFSNMVTGQYDKGDAKNNKKSGILNGPAPGSKASLGKQAITPLHRMLHSLLALHSFRALHCSLHALLSSRTLHSSPRPPSGSRRARAPRVAGRRRRWRWRATSPSTRSRASWATSSSRPS